MRGRPGSVLLRRFAPLAAVAVLLAPAQALAATPAPDRAPSAPGGLAPDPVPGSTPTHPAATVPATRRPVYVAPAHTVTTKTRSVPKQHAPARPARKPAVSKRASVPAAFALPHVAVPALGTVAPARALRGLDVLLASVALLLAAAAAGSGARLVSVYNRRAGTT